MSSAASQRWQSLSDAFARLIDLPAGEARDHAAAAAAPDIRAELIELVRSHERLEVRPRFIAPRLEGGLPLPLAPGDGIGGCRIERCLGTGGMGVVYLAQQARPQRRVALKVIRDDRRTGQLLARFELEADALGRLQHAAIAQVFGVGLSERPDGSLLPYMIIEYVEGSGLREHLQAASPRARARIELLARLCDGVQHAHQKGVIHRDLKPSNILVDSRGNPKILDFGIARLVGPDSAAPACTQAGELLGTLAYMSPEQVARDPQRVDTRTDIYALGLIGFEMLTGRRPYDPAGLPLAEAARLIEAGGERAVAQARDLPRDLRYVLRRMICADPAQRYASAGEAAADLRRFLAGDAVRARPPTLAYALSLVARRHKAAFAAALTVLTSLLAATAVSISYAIRSDRDNVRAQQAAAMAQAINKLFLEDVFSGAHPDTALGEALTVRAMVDRAADLVGAIDEPLVRAAVHDAIAGLYSALATPAGRDDAPLLVQGLEHARHALRIRLASGAEPRDVAQSYERLGVCLSELGLHDDAIAANYEALALRARLDGRTAPSVARLHTAIATSYLQLGDPGCAALHVDQALAQDLAAAADDATLAASLGVRGDLDARAGRLRDAECAYRAALLHARRVPRPDQSMLSGLLDRLGAVLWDQGGREEGLALRLEAFSIQSHVLPAGSPARGRTALALASVHLDLGDYAAALELADEGVAIYQAALGAQPHPWVARGLVWRGRALVGLRRFDEALGTLSQALAIADASGASEHPDLIDALSLRGACLCELGRLSDGARDLHAASSAYDRLGSSADGRKVAGHLERVSHYLSAP